MCNNHDDALHDDALHDDALHDDALHDDALHDDALHDDALHDDALHDDALHDDALHDEFKTLQDDYGTCPVASKDDQLGGQAEDQSHDVYDENDWEEDDGEEEAGRGNSASEDTDREDVAPDVPHDGVAPAKRQPPLLGSTKLIGKYFRAMFDTEGWGDALGERPAYRSGRIARAEGSLAKRRLTDPEARFYYMVMMSEAALMPFCVASNASERDQFNKELAGILGLDVAVRRGWITSFTICWRQKPFPKSPTHVRIISPRGRTARSKALGELEPEIRRIVSFAKGESPHRRR